MAWPGIPFLPEHFISNSYLAISEIPKVIIDSEFSWGSAIVTILGALIGGGIPAWIAWRTIKNSQILIKNQILISQQVEKTNKIRELSSNFLSDMEVLGAYIICKQKYGNSGQPSLSETEVKEFFFVDAKGINVSINSITLLLNDFSPIYNDIVKSLFEIQKKIYLPAEGAYSLDNSGNNILGLRELLNDFIGEIKLYIRMEMESIKNTKSS